MKLGLGESEDELECVDCGFSFGFIFERYWGELEKLLSCGFNCCVFWLCILLFL